MRKVILILTTLLLFISCEIYSQDEYEEIIVVEAYMIANRQLPEVRVSRTMPVDIEYNFDDSAISGATVLVSLLDESGNREQTFAYLPVQPGSGVYNPAIFNHTVLPGRTYRLEIEFLNRPESIRAETTIPGQVSIINEIREEVIYQSEEQLEIVLAPSDNTVSQNIFVFDSITLDPAEDNMTPFYSAAVRNGNAKVEDFINNSSGLINEGNFTLNADRSISLKFPWIGVAFYGDNLIVTNSVDQNLADLVRSQEVQLGGSTLSPGEIPNLIYNIDGGIGIFGSISTDTVQTRFLRP
jgi:hypothetical protein